MKTSFCLLSFTLCFGAIAVETPLLRKVMTSEPTRAELQFARTCNVFRDRVEITSKGGAGSSIVTHKASLTKNIEKMISEASKGKITRGPRAGSATLEWFAYMSDKGKLVKVVLKSLGGSTRGTTMYNDSPVAESLVRLVDLTCF